MIVTGVIMECNPFHEGHAHILREARKRTGADYVVAVMSGDFVQRGDPAVFDKYFRARQILAAGADLVLELPLYGACSSAEYFAESGIALLDRLGVVTDLCFGSESSDLEHLQLCARLLRQAEEPRTALDTAPGEPGESSALDTAPGEPGGSSALDTAPGEPGESSAPDTAPGESSALNTATGEPGESSALDTAPVEPGGSSAQVSPAASSENPVEVSPEASAGGSPMAVAEDTSAAFFREALRAGLRGGMTFPAARSAALAALYPPGASSSLPGIAAPGPGASSSLSGIAAPGPGASSSLPGIDASGPGASSSLPGIDASGPGASSSLPGIVASGPGAVLPYLPNDVLGVEYLRALSGRGSRIRPHALPRIDVPSASARRKELLLRRRKGLPALLEDGSGISVFAAEPDDFSAQLLYALRMQEASLERFADVSGDLANRIRALLPRYRSFSQFTDLLKTRGFTRTRISRALLHILLQMEQEKLDLFKKEGGVFYARPLALNRDAAPLFSAIRRSSTIPFLSKPARADRVLRGHALSFFLEELRAEDLYSLTLAAAAGRSAKEPVPRAVQRGLVTDRSAAARL